MPLHSLPFPSLLRLIIVLLLSSTLSDGQYGGNPTGGGYGPSGGALYSSPDIIDNEVVAPPAIRCTDRGVEFSINTRNPFRGNIYVQGQFGLAECRREFYNNDAPFGSIEVRLNDCGMSRERRPPGMSYSLVIMVNFHPRFVTRVDRAYKIHCSYRQLERPVGVDIEVGSIPTDVVHSESHMVPDCEYTMRVGDVNGPPAPGAVKVGELIYHRWECQQSEVYGMLVKNCRVFDGGNDNVTLLDERGCPTHSGVIQSPPVYSDNLNLAWAPVFAFHFPDRTQMNFRCQIQSCNKQDNECQGITPPNCPQNYGTAYSTPRLPYPTYPSPAGPYGLPVATPIAQYPQQHFGAGAFQRPWVKKHRHEQEKMELKGVEDGGQPRELEQKILMATQKLRRQEDESWWPYLVILNKTSGELNRAPAGAGTPRRFFRPLPEVTYPPEGEERMMIIIGRNFEEREMRQRQRRAEEQTQDVVASSTVINDGLQGFEWSYENGKARVRPRDLGDLSVGADRSRVSNQSYCLDGSALLALFAALGLISAFCLALLCYVLWDLVFRGRRFGRNRINWSPKCSNGTLFGIPRKYSFKFPSPASSFPPAAAPSDAKLPPPALHPPQFCQRTADTESGTSPQEILAGILTGGGPAGRGRVPPPVPPKTSSLMMGGWAN